MITARCARQFHLRPQVVIYTRARQVATARCIHNFRGGTKRCFSTSLYDVLGVRRSASGSEIKQAYRKLAMKWHPDQNADKENATKKFQEISHAYQTLSDGQQRSQYDSFGTTGRGMGGGGGFGGGDFGGGGFDGGRQMSPEEAEQLFKEAFGDDMRNMLRDMAKMQQEMNGQPFQGGGFQAGGQRFQEMVVRLDGKRVIRTTTVTMQPGGGQKRTVHEEEVDEEQLRKQQELAKKMMKTVARGVGGMVVKAVTEAAKQAVTNAAKNAVTNASRAITGLFKKNKT